MSETVTKGGKADALSYVYDETGSNVVKLTRNGESQQYSYLPEGAREALTYGSGQKVSYDYDSEGKLKTIKLNGKPVKSYVYSNKGVLTSVQSYTAAGKAYVSLRYTYDWLGRISKTEHLAENGDVKELHELKYGADDNITQEKTTEYYNGAKVTDRLYEYDWLKRLTKENVNGTSVSYTYDKVGNRLTMTKNGESYSYSYNVQDQLTEVKKGSQTVASYSYDIAGNQISKTEDGKTTTYTYDQANQLEKLQSGNTVLGEYSYDAQGQRLTKKVGATTTKYYYDSLDLLYTKENDTLSEVNVLADDGDIVLGLRGSKEYRYIKDVRGSVTNILDSAGAVVLSYTYDAYGNTEASNQSFKNSFAYTGAVIDPESGLYYMNARYYDPATGRFISQDSYRGDGESFWHLYAYCDGDPVNASDPTGNKPKYLKNSKLLNATYLSWKVRLKSVYSAKTCLNRIYKNDSYINKYGKKFGIPSNMIRAILYWELMCIGIDDEVADYQVIDYYSRRKGSRKDSSTGMGQIFAATAIKAEARVMKKLSVISIWDMWKKLQKDKDNIYYCAMVLKMGAKKLKYNTIKTTDYKKIKNVFARYNNYEKGSPNYGEKVLSVYKEFKKG